MRTATSTKLRRLPFVWLVAGLTAAIVPAACSDDDGGTGPGPIDTTSGPIDTTGVERFTYTVVAEYPHDSGAFTQGLVFLDSVLYEGTGYYLGESTVRKVRLQTGEVLQSRAIGSYFGEGITIWGDRIIQLTWTSKVGFVWALEDFSPQGQFNYPTEGWGLTHDGTRLIMSDGTATLNFLDPRTFANVGSVEVTDESGQPVVRLNELEYIDGEVWANVYLTNWIVRIDPETGRVTAWIDMSDLLDVNDRPGAKELNGIAYDPDGDRLFVTGKLWPKLFEVDLEPVEETP